MSVGGLPGMSGEAGWRRRAGVGTASRVGTTSRPWRGKAKHSPKFGLGVACLGPSRASTADAPTLRNVRRHLVRNGTPVVGRRDGFDARHLTSGQIGGERRLTPPEVDIGRAGLGARDLTHARIRSARLFPLLSLTFSVSAPKSCRRCGCRLTTGSCPAHTVSGQWRNRCRRSRYSFATARPTIRGITEPIGRSRYRRIQ